MHIMNRLVNTGQNEPHTLEGHHRLPLRTGQRSLGTGLYRQVTL